MSILRKRAKDTLTAVEMDEGDLLEFTLTDGRRVRLELLATHAEVIRTTLDQLKVEQSGGRTDIRFSCRLVVDGQEHTLEREISSQSSFYEPWVIGPLRIWFDCADKIFDFLTETHGPCRTQVHAHDPAKRQKHKHARFAIQQADLRICPDLLHPWCPLPEHGLSIDLCYRGDNCWLGGHMGASAHGGLDINHPPGTPLWTPLDVHDHFYFESLEQGQSNNRWRAIHHWPNGAQWILQVHHLSELVFPEHQPIGRGQRFALGATVRCGKHPHSHFVFKVHDEGETILLDPWILFWQMYRDLPYL